MRKIWPALGAVIGLGGAVVAHAVEVNFDGSMDNICTISGASDGSLASSVDGQTLDSELTGGTNGSVTIVSTGANTVSFSAPTLAASPTGYGGTPSLNIAYSGAGVTQGDTSTSSSHTIDYPGGTIDIDASAVDAAGFPSGTYTIRTTVTCAPI